VKGPSHRGARRRPTSAMGPIADSVGPRRLPSGGGRADADRGGGLGSGGAARGPRLLARRPRGRRVLGPHGAGLARRRPAPPAPPCASPPPSRSSGSSGSPWPTTWPRAWRACGPRSARTPGASCCACVAASRRRRWRSTCGCRARRGCASCSAGGGRVHVGRVDEAGADQIAANHDLTFVATGKEGASWFTRDPAKSPFTAPLRHLAMVNVDGPPMAFPDVPFLAAKFNILEGAGECYWTPYWHQDGRAVWNLVFEARPGGPIDVFGGCRSGDEVLARSVEVVQRWLPWDSAWLAGARLSDPNSWLTGAITPTVRDPVGRTRSGRLLLPLGDAYASFDPLGAQGANMGNRLARELVRALRERGGRARGRGLGAVHVRRVPRALGGAVDGVDPPAAGADGPGGPLPVPGAARRRRHGARLDARAARGGRVRRQLRRPGGAAAGVRRGRRDAGPGARAPGAAAGTWRRSRGCSRCWGGRSRTPSPDVAYSQGPCM
jgi:hypothetical protein